MSSWSSYRGARAFVGRCILHLMSVFLPGYLAYDGWKLGDPVQMAVAVPMVFIALFFWVKSTWTTFGVSVALCTGLGGCLYYTRLQDSKAFRPIAAISKKVAMASHIERQITLPCRAIIWDVQEDKLSWAHYRLPYALRAKPDDQAITIFMLWSVRSDFVWKYHNKSSAPSFKVDAEGYRDTADFAVVQWPEQQLISWHSLAGTLPPKEIEVQAAHAHDPVHGGWVEPLVQWVQALPGGSIVASAGPHRWTQAEAQAEAIRRYPQLGLADSPLNHAFVEKYQQLKASNSSQLGDPAWPLQLARELAQ